MTNPNHCGQVGHPVPSAPNATVGCLGGVAVVVSCNAGWFNVNGSVVDGCEFREDLYEQNDTSATARPLSWGPTIIANVAPQGDEDWFSFGAS